MSKRINESEDFNSRKLNQNNEGNIEVEDNMDQGSDGMGEFEDPYEDEMEEENFVEQENDMEDSDDEVHEIQDEEIVDPDVRVYLPGQALEEGEELQVDNSAYVMLHQMSMNWPCLSFDIIPDHLGNDRTKFPMTMYLATGTQADKPSNNEITVMKLSKLCKTKYDDDEPDAASDDEEEANLDMDPILEHRSLKHLGGVNRIRIHSQPNVNLAATWSETGKVHIYDLMPQLTSLDNPGHAIAPKATEPVFTIHSHADEGFAMDWSKLNPGRLLTGDCSKQIYLTTLDGSSFKPDRVPFSGHKSSVEDLQWSPSEKNVFASASADCTVKVWDLRNKKKSALSVQVHQMDVNVISWNHQVNYLLASGCDDGSFAVWDLRNFNATKPTPVANFKWHSAPITSIEWNASEESVLAVAGADDQISLWDLSVEPDDEDPTLKNDGAILSTSNGDQVPPQLLFVHQGQQDIKEAHWHPQIPGTLVSTSGSGFNVFKTISI